MSNVNESHPFDSTDLELLSLRFGGKLLLRHEILLEEALFERLLAAQLFKSYPSMVRKKRNNECQRCGNQHSSLFGKIPCQRCHQTHWYCRNCITMGRVLECEPLYVWMHPVSWKKYENPCAWEGKLTVHQEHAATQITLAITNLQAELLIWAVCGSGKTEMLFPGLAEALRRGKRICIAAPRVDVVRELLPRIKRAFSSVNVQALYGGSEDKEATAQLLIVTTHQLLRFKEAFDVMIIDEIDAFPYHCDPTLSFAANRAKARQNTTIYLTATPRKEQQIKMIRKKLPHIFVPIRFHGHPLPVPKMKLAFSLQKKLTNNRLPQPFISWLKERKNPQRQLLIFVPTISLAEKINDMVTNILIREQIIISKEKCTFVHAEDRFRDDKIHRFRKRELIVLVTTTILERGVTFPSVDVAVIDAGHEVFDEAALVQIAGRAGRSVNDPTGEVVFFHDGKTEAMLQAIHAIKLMNRRGGF